MNKELVLIAHNIRSTHNVGSIFRTCDGFGIKKVFLTGYTPYPKSKNDNRLPHLAEKINGQIHKTALGAEQSVDWENSDDVFELIQKLRDLDYKILALEQDPNSTKVYNFKFDGKIALLIGEEVEGIDKNILKLCDEIVEIPMKGQKESFNVSVAVGIALYQLRFSNLSDL